MFITGALLVGGALYAGAKTLGKFSRQQDAQTFLLNERAISPQKKALQPIVDEGRALLERFQSLIYASNDVRDQQMQALAVTEELSEEEQWIIHFFKVSTGVVALAATTFIVFPAAHIIAIPPLLYTLFPIFLEAYEGVKECRLTPALVDCTAVFGVLAIGLPTLNPYYFLAGALGVWVYYLSSVLLHKTENKSRKSLVHLFDEQPRSVWLLRDGVEVEIPFENVQAGDIVVVNAGEMIPVDGTITDGIASIDQRMLTGEAQPAEKGRGDDVFAATGILAGRICIDVAKAGTDVLSSQIAEILNRTASYQTSVESRSEALSKQAVLPMLGTSALALSMLGPVSAVAVLLSNFSNVVKLAAPIGMLNFLHLASHGGILVKDGRSLELLKQVDTVIFDKTGTLTLEQPHVGNIYLCNGYDEQVLLTYAAAVETRQSHPIAKAIVQAATERDLRIPALSEAEYEVGYGIKARIDHHVVRVGSDRYMEIEGISIPAAIRESQEQSYAEGHSLVMVAIDDHLGGGIVLQPTIRPEARDIIRRLRKRQLSLCIISGDHEQPTKNLADGLGIDQYFAQTLPEDKATLIAQLQKSGKSVCFIGDGINDAIALKQANVSISLRGATTAATDSAQMIMMDGSLKQLDQVFDLGQKFNSNLRTSLTTALGLSGLCIGGIFILHFGIYSVLILNTVTIIASVGNAFLPAMNGQPALVASSTHQKDQTKTAALRHVT